MPECTFTITYWGITGTLTAPLRPEEVTRKLVHAVRLLVEQGKLADLRPGPNLEPAVRRIVEENLPFCLRSSYGGNTTCVEVETPDALLIFDCGSGFRELGVALDRRWRDRGNAARRTAHVLVTHPHMDHTYATPYFLPYYDPRNSFVVYGSRIVLDSLSAVLNPHSALSQIYFPPTFDQLTAIRDWREIKADETFAIGTTKIATYALQHPGGALAFRLENAGKVFVFATDHEQRQVPDRGLAEFARAADLLYTEGQFTQAEYEGREGISGDPPLKRIGWGHSPVEACARTAIAAGVRRLHLGHRDPRRSDADLAAVEKYLQQVVHAELVRNGQATDALHAVIPFEGMQCQL